MTEARLDRTQHARPPVVRRGPDHFLLWRDEWYVGIDVLDTEHRELAALIDGIAMRFSAGSATNRDACNAKELQRWLRLLGER